MKNKIVIKISLVLFFAILLMPIYFMFIGSFQKLNGMMSMPPQLYPKEFTLTNYLSMFDFPVFTWIKNTFVSLFIIVLISTFISASTGYVFATTRFKGKELIWSILLLGLLMPRISMLIPQFMILKYLHISGTLLAIILSTAYTSYGTLLARNYFESIPKSIFEAAMIDGADDSQILYNIVIPISPPAIITLALSTSIFHLSDYLWQSLVLQKEQHQTLMIGLMKAISQFMANQYGINPLGRMMAVGIVLLFPLLIIFLIANKYYLSAKGGEIKE